MSTDRVRNGQGGMFALALAAALVLLAAPAEAKDEFEDGFKDELGRIAAHEAVYAGKHILADILLAGGYVHHRPHRSYGHRHDHGYRRHVIHVPPGHRKHHHKHYKHKHRKHYKHYAGYGHYGPYGGHGYVVRHEHHHYYDGAPCGNGYDY